MIRFFNTLSGKLEEFQTLHENEVRMYTCGPTVYDYAHIGNFRAFVFEDLLRRFLEFKGFRVKHVMNITDVDDKTIAGAGREGKALEEFTARYIQAFFEDLQALNILPANHPSGLPRATGEIPAMIALVEKLIRKRIAYVNDGSVYYRVSLFPTYGKLSKKKLEKNLTGARVDVDEYDKEESSDFALWKQAKPSEPAWDSPWGKGRPGWHLECSAMSMKYLGETFDIHAGGEDLIFPHHENEIAQSEAATGKPFVRYWLHCKHLLVNGEKMSKTKGNYYTLRDLLAKGYDPMMIRYVLLTSHYRTQLNFTLESLNAAANSLNDLKLFYSSVTNHCTRMKRSFSTSDQLGVEIDRLESGMEESLADDLNISSAMASLFLFIGKADEPIKAGRISEKNWHRLKMFLDKLDSTLLALIGDQCFDSLDEEIKRDVFERDRLREAKRFGEADKIRQNLRVRSVLLWDEPSGVTGVAR